MRIISIVIVGLALLLAGAVFFLVPRLMSRNAQEVQQAQSAQPQRLAAQDVLVAAHNLPSGAVLKPEDVRWQRWPEEALDPSFFIKEKGADPKVVAVGMIVLHGIGVGEPVTAARLLKPGEGGFLAATLTPGMRAATININPITGTAGFILPNDQVDVMLIEHYSVTLVPQAAQATANLPQITTKDVSSIVLRNVKVLAIDQGTQDIDSKPHVGATATLEVDLQQAQKLSLASGLGTLSLVLRSHTLPQHPNAEATPAIVEDYQVSPFRAAVMEQFLTNLAQGQQPQGSSEGGLRVYHGAALAGSK